MSDNKILVYTGLAIAGVAALFSGLYIKNKVLYKPLPKTKIIEITRDLRKVLQERFQLVINISEKAKAHKMPIQAVKQMIEGEESMNLRAQIRQQTQKICRLYGTNGNQYEKSISHYINDPEIKKCTSILQKDYQLALKGQVNSQLFGEIPEISVEKLLQIVKKKTQQDFLNRLEQVRLTKGKTEADLNDPAFNEELYKLETAGIDDVLSRNGLKSQDDALIHVYNILVSNLEKKDPSFRVRVKNIQATFNQLFDKHVRAYGQTGNQEHLNNLQDQILYLQL